MTPQEELLRDAVFQALGRLMTLAIKRNYRYALNEAEAILQDLGELLDIKEEEDGSDNR